MEHYRVQRYRGTEQPIQKRLQCLWNFFIVRIVSIELGSHCTCYLDVIAGSSNPERKLGRQGEGKANSIVREIMKFQRTCLPYLIIVAMVMSIYSVFLVHLTKSPFGPSIPTVRILELPLNHGVFFDWRNIRCTCYATVG